MFEKARCAKNVTKIFTIQFCTKKIRKKKLPSKNICCNNINMAWIEWLFPLHLLIVNKVLCCSGCYGINYPCSFNWLPILSLDNLFQRWQIPRVLVDHDHVMMTRSQRIRDEDTFTRANQRAAWSRLRPGFSSLSASVSLCSSESSSPSSFSASSPRETREENEGIMKLRNFLTRQTQCT